MKEFRNDDSLLVDDVASRVGDSMKDHVSRADLLVENSVLTDDSRFHVGEKRVGDASLAAELG
jgi:hypothetical protein